MTDSPEASPKPGGLKRVWRAPDGTPVGCVEKLKILEENIDEIRDLCREALEDAVLMGCDEKQVRAVLHEVIDALDTPFQKK